MSVTLSPGALRPEDLQLLLLDDSAIPPRSSSSPPIKIDPAFLEPLAFAPNDCLVPHFHPLDGSFLQSAFDDLDTQLLTPRSIKEEVFDPSVLSPHTKVPAPTYLQRCVSSASMTSSSSTKPHALCQVPNCGRRVRSKGYCKAHGGGRKCSVPGCGKSSQNGEFCIGHGGGKQCKEPGCAKAAQSHGLCKAHGGGARCKHLNCMKSSQGGGFCRAHGGGKRCQAENCTKGAQRGNFCATHGGFRSCQEPNCVRTDRGGGYCEVHRQDKLCTAKGCKKLSKNHGLCTVHLRKVEKAAEKNALAAFAFSHSGAIDMLSSIPYYGHL
ncbi:hypothetical protein SDRG_09851 [Saprolegnia diclina VS20]|uniref:WRKY19-like zinc finger domain-containing protein n=1 Tax=Saprolegnia diclina (strain VS20) TaxID=1156394 RepID=T0QG14_SAPDV|nr:hypothetical protein SDRG_09851 [Saprolegnia diclina VS20]EQC32525.1 hypothetical protein SDRG_09851 [Saprolegnia diclina VS20]|eukprot:XP_008614026.1 hypothetical protein SDRG_09851 [Saprolegnia diclina VS20]